MTTWRDFAVHRCFTHTWMTYVPGLPRDLDFPEILALRATYRRRLTRRLEWTLGLLDEGHCDVLDRFGPVTQLWLVQEFFEGRASLGAGGGVYRAISDSREDSPHTRESALVISLTGRVLLDPRWGVRLTWDRIVTDDNRDSDVGVLGVGYLF